MSFIKKLFGFTDYRETSAKTIEDSLLDRYRQVPWMTNTRLENVRICLLAGFKPSNSLPTEFEKELRPTIEIARRLHAIKAMVLWVWAPEESVPSETILNFANHNLLGDYMSESERNILRTSRDDIRLKNIIGWKFENAWPLAWYFGYIEPDISGQMMTGDQMHDILTNHTCPLDGIVDFWIRDKKTISEVEILNKEDLFYCLHNAVRSAQLGRETVPSDFDPGLNGGVIHERRHSLTWMLSKNTGWDETDLST